jgi:hypothetical protein
VSGGVGEKREQDSLRAALERAKKALGNGSTWQQRADAWKVCDAALTAESSREAGTLPDLESLAADFHRIYQAEAKRQGDVRHADNYEDLPENVKDFDRALARHVLLNFGAAEPLSQPVEQPYEKTPQPQAQPHNLDGVQVLMEASKNLLEACYQADAREELSEEIDGSLLDAVRDGLISAHVALEALENARASSGIAGAGESK